MTDYARSICDQLKEKGFYDDVGKFDVTDQVTTTARFDLIFQGLNYCFTLRKLRSKF